MMLSTPSEGSHALPQISAATDLDLSTCLYTSTYKALCAESSLAAAFILANQRTASSSVSSMQRTHDKQADLFAVLQC